MNSVGGIEVVAVVMEAQAWFEQYIQAAVVAVIGTESVVYIEEAELVHNSDAADVEQARFASEDLE